MASISQCLLVAGRRPRERGREIVCEHEDHANSYIGEAAEVDFYGVVDHQHGGCESQDSAGIIIVDAMEVYYMFSK